MPVALVRTTMSIGFSNTVTRASTLFTSIGCSCFGVAPRVASGMSSSGVPCRDCGSAFGVRSLIVVSSASLICVASMVCGLGDIDACGVGSDGGSSARLGASEARLLRTALAALTVRRFGGDFFDGDTGSSITLSGGLKICDGSTDSPVLVWRVRVDVRGVAVASVILRRDGDFVTRVGAGVSSSSSSSLSCSEDMMLFSLSSSSESKRTILR